MLDKLSFHVKFTLCQLLTSLLQCLFERIKPGICDLEGDSDLPALVARFTFDELLISQDLLDP